MAAIRPVAAKIPAAERADPQVYRPWPGCSQQPFNQGVALAAANQNPR